MGPFSILQHFEGPYNAFAGSSLVLGGIILNHWDRGLLEGPLGPYGLSRSFRFFAFKIETLAMGHLGTSTLIILSCFSIFILLSFSISSYIS